MSDGLVTGTDELEQLFDDLAGELAKVGDRAEVVMVGGSWLLWFSLRHSTRDVDSASRLEQETKKAIAEVGERHGLPAGWLNDRAFSFWPYGFSFEDCDVIYQAPNLTVRAPDAEVIFLMKLDRRDPQDREDLIDLWPICDFGSPQVAADRYFDAYPNAIADPHLASWIAGVAADAEGS